MGELCPKTNTMEKHQKIALVTGGSRGLGRDMALNLAKNGMDVIITYNNNREAAEATLTELRTLGQRAAALQLDVAEHSGYTDFLEQRLLPCLRETFGCNRFDYLVNNAGIGLFSPYGAEVEVSKITEIINIHFMAGYLFTQKALGLMNDGGGIVNISTGLTRIILPGFAAYAAIKGALEVLTKYQAKELGPRRIRVNIVAPGAIATDFNGGAVRDNDGMNRSIAENTALGRVGLPTDIGPVVAFLCTEKGQWINAQRIEVSGGQHL